MSLTTCNNFRYETFEWNILEKRSGRVFGNKRDLYGNVSNVSISWEMFVVKNMFSLYSILIVYVTFSGKVVLLSFQFFLGQIAR